MPNFNNLNIGAFDNVSWESSKGEGGASRVDRPIYRLQKDRVARVRFLTDPGNMAFDPSLAAFYTEDKCWVKYREARAFDDYKGDIKASHKFIPVVDFELTPNGGRKDRKDALQQQIRPSDTDLKNKRSFASAKDVMLINVIFEGHDVDQHGNPIPVFNKNADYDPTDGNVIVLALSPKQVETIANEVKTAKKYKPGFTLTEGVWNLLWQDLGTGGPTGWVLQMVQEEAAPLDFVPDPIDALAILRQIRQIAEAEVFGTGSTEADIVEDFEESVAATLAEDEAVADDDETPVAPAAPTRRSPAYVKGMLRKAGVEVPARISNEDLYALAAQHGIAA